MYQPMRIAVVHSFYSSRATSGENFVVQAQVKALRAGGHEVELIGAQTDYLEEALLYKVRSAFTVATGVGTNPLGQLGKFQPDITVVHNLFPNFGSSWMSQWKGPIVRVLHNFRLFCANGLFFRNGHLCFDCVEKSPVRGLLYGCYRDSPVATLPLTVAQMRREISNVEISQPSGYFALSQVAADTLIKAGLPSDRVFIVPNFIGDFWGSDPLPLRKRNGRWVAVGRLTREKGFYDLVKNWPEQYQLDIIGDGPDFDEIQIMVTKHANIRLLGRLDKQELLNRLPRYEGAILPSLWLEAAALTVLEFLCAGLPVISTAVNSAAPTISNHKSGIVLDEFTVTALASAIELITEEYCVYSHNARYAYISNFSPKIWTDAAVSIFNQLVKM